MHRQTAGQPRPPTHGGLEAVATLSFFAAGFLFLFALLGRDSMCGSSDTAWVIIVLSPVAALVVGVVEAIVGWSVRTRWQTRLATSGIVLSVAAAVMLMALPWSSSSVCGID